MRQSPANLARKNEDKERVRDASDIVRVVGEHVALKAKGREYVGLCPFHDDRKPSMNVVPSKQIFHCFVCQTGGDVFSFVEKYHKMDFREALEYLAERAGITLIKSAPSADQWSQGGSQGSHDGSGGHTGGHGGGHDGHSQGDWPVETGGPVPLTRADLVGASAAAAAFFRTILKHPEHGRAAREIIERRGISPEMVQSFGLGAAPDRWDGLVLTVQKQGLNRRAFAQTGLLKRRESDNSFYDAFRNRLMFPIQDQIGRVIAFGARKIKEEDEPKYLNSPESPLFDKSATLYGLHQAAREIQKQRIAIITEGYTDTIACHQAGVSNAVATLGTALTTRHASILRRHCDTVVLLFDGDDAGQRAADRAVEVFFAEDIDVRIATLATVTDAKDPDELLKREGGRDLLLQAIGGATDLLDFRYRRIRRRLAGAGMAAMTRAIEEELAHLVQLGLNSLPMLRRRLIIKQIASIAGVDEQTITKSIPGGRKYTSPREADNAPKAPRTLSTREHALACILCEPMLWETLSDSKREHLDPDLFDRPAVQATAHAIFDLAAAGPWSFTDLCTHLDDGDSRSAATDLYMRMRALTDGAPDRIATFLSDCMQTLINEGPAEMLSGASGGESFETSDDSVNIPFGADLPPPAPVAPSLEAIRERRAAMGDNRRVIPGARAG